MRFAAADALDVHVPHKPCHRATCDNEAFPEKLPPDLADAVDLVVLLPDALDLGPQGGITTGTVWTCPVLVPLRLLIYAALASKAKGLFPAEG